jgi:hypothetical protein
MEIRLPKKLVDAAIEETSSKALVDAKENALRFGSSNPKMLDIQGHLLDKTTLKFLYAQTKDRETEYANAIEFLYKALKNPSNIVIKKMADVGPGLQQYLKSAKLKNWLFRRGPYKSLLGYVVTKVEMNRRQNSYRSGTEVEHVGVTLAYSEDSVLRSEYIAFNPSALRNIFSDNNVEYREIEKTHGKGDNEYTYLKDVVSEEGVPVDALIRKHEFFLESDELHETYEKQISNYFRYVKMYGQQFRVRGTGEQLGGWGYGAYDSDMLVDGKPGRAIMNTIPNGLFTESEEGGTPAKRAHSRYRSRYDAEEENLDAKLPSDPQVLRAAFEDLDPSEFEVKTRDEYAPISKENNEIVVPMHPTLRIFHLHKTQDYRVHCNCLIPYKYKENIEEQLVLPENVKKLTRMLVAASSSTAADVIEGKSQSTILACIGDPGLGKTLLAEVMSEACQKPLYKIQAAQLGLDATELEKNLQRILQQAQRWNAVLMIDEANAYVHSRGHDIAQNAIVGVFLRLLEYYRGVMILTTNMTNSTGAEDHDVGFDIDDAILQRCSAVFKFVVPTPAFAAKIWRLQASLMDVELDKEMVKHLSSTHKLSGRSIRNLLKLAVNWARTEGEALDLKHFDACGEVIPLTRSERYVQPDKAK